MAIVPYVAINWLNTGTRTPNNLRVWIEAYIIDHADAKKSDWQQLYDFAMVATQEDPNSRGSSLLAFEVNAITAVDPAFDQWME